MPEVRLDEAEYKRRFRAQYVDPAFDALQAELERIAEAAWDGYRNSRKAPRTRKAGAGFEDPDYDLSIAWIAAKAATISSSPGRSDGSCAANPSSRT